MPEEKKKRKHRKHTWNDANTGNKLHKEKFGFIEIDNPEFYKKNNGYFAVPEFLMRKPTPEERKEIIVNYVIAHDGQEIDMGILADRLCISYRLMLMILKQLREEKIIEVVHTFTENGKQTKNKYKYIGPSCEKYGSGLTLDMLYSVDNEAGFRDWDWEDFKFKRDGAWYDLEGLDDLKWARRKLKRTYLESVGASPSHGVRNANFITIRYSHWISQKDGKPTPPEHIKINYLTGEKYDDRPGNLSADGTKKYELGEEHKIFAFSLFGIFFAAEYNGDKNDPQVKLFDPRTNEEYVVFSYWGDNCVHFTWDDTEEDRERHLQITGEFTSK